MKHVQDTNFDDTLLKSGGYCKLSPTKSSDALIQVGGRLTNATLADNAKHPWILPTRHPVTTLIIRHYHATTGHSGSERTLAEIRQKCWIIRGRASVKSIIHTCIPCRKRKAPTMTQRMADLPKDRVTPGLAPFSMNGVDFFGSFMIKRTRSELKRYGCIFTCLATRAVHLEVCHNLETSSFINALQRFIRRREIRSDNGTNLVGGMPELGQAIQDWNHDKIDNICARRRFNGSSTPLQLATSAVCGRGKLGLYVQFSTACSISKHSMMKGS
ncbi:uncharacterized protein LOC119733842 [Patiria miniata]|uniref:Integrase zinc-binding domain-containing protein n=1 Tax=Patiria miniata TaxID=46514 RepID=A0A914AHI0_PATMI|nr:uncharacterized protein LOC119733842 [Patiria miniata]